MRRPWRNSELPLGVRRCWCSSPRSCACRRCRSTAADLQHAAKGAVVTVNDDGAMPAAISSFNPFSISSAGNWPSRYAPNRGSTYLRGHGDRSPAWLATAAGTETRTPRPRPRAACPRCGDRPIAAKLICVDLPKEPLGVGLASEGTRLITAERVGESRSILPPLFWM